MKRLRLLTLIFLCLSLPAGAAVNRACVLPEGLADAYRKLIADVYPPTNVMVLSLPESEDSEQWLSIINLVDRAIAQITTRRNAPGQNDRNISMLRMRYGLDGTPGASIQELIRHFDLTGWGIEMTLRASRKPTQKCWIDLAIALAKQFQIPAEELPPDIVSLVPNKGLDDSIEVLYLRARARALCERRGLITIRELTAKTRPEMEAIMEEEANFKEGTILDIETKLAAFGYHFTTELEFSGLVSDPVEVLPFATRTLKMFRREHITTLMELVNTSAAEIIRIGSLEHLAHIKAVLWSVRLRLKNAGRP